MFHRHILATSMNSGRDISDELNVEDEETPSHPYFGLLLSIISAILVGGSFILQKKGLIRSTTKLSNKDKHKGFAYLGQWLWWVGMFSMAVGEIINFVAYTIAPAILITPLGALRVIVSAILSSIFLGEYLNSIRKAGVLLSVVGSTMVVLHAPRQEKVSTYVELVVRFMDPWFLVYCCGLLLISIILIVFVAPRHGHRKIMVYLTICNMIGAVTVLCGKGLGISIKNLFADDQPTVYLHPLFWVLILGNVIGIPVQVVYINKALAMFDASAVTPIKYVFTNIFLIIGSILLFDESLNFEDFVGFACGFVTIVVGVVLINSYKETPKSYYEGNEDDLEMSPLQ